MPVTHIEADFNLNEIAKAAKISKMQTKNNILVYGLVKETRENPDQEINPPVIIRYNEDYTDMHTFNPPIEKFFKKNGMKMEFEYVSDRDFGIGLRTDVRENVKLSAALIKTIVAYVEERLQGIETFEVKGLTVYAE